MIKNTNDFNKERIKLLEEKVKLLEKKFTLKDAMRFRSNIRFYKQDDIPSKEVIEEIIQDAHNFIPHKNNMIECNIKIYGPEFAKEKEDLVLSTMCGAAKEFWRKDGQHEHDYEFLRKIYEDWRPKNATSNGYDYEYNYRDPRWPEDYKLAFNEQVRAPYLLVYTQRLRRPSKIQNQHGFPEFIFKFTKKYDDSLAWYTSAAMHGFGTALLAAEKGITASYCKCFHNDKVHRNPILAPMYEKGGPSNIAFTLSLGYKDPSGVNGLANRMKVNKYESLTNKNQLTIKHNKMNIDEYVSWAKNDRE
tara:strand:- start:157 stop:1068 length:912 start_codon:yes stop_codon:yes gene_type:complete